MQSLGFILLIVIAWVDAWLDLSQRWFGGDVHSGWQESSIRTAGILTVWGIVYFTTKHLLNQLYHVEKFVRMCSWCRKLGNDRGEWMSMEEHFATHHNSEASHGGGYAAAATTDRGIGGVQGVFILLNTSN